MKQNENGLVHVSYIDQNPGTDPIVFNHKWAILGQVLNLVYCQKILELQYLTV
jgi:hypothetical protein